MLESTTSMICFIEARIKRVSIDRPLSTDEIKYGRIRVGADILRDYDPRKHEFEVIRKDKFPT